ncbi:MAG: YeeE/YedE family protein [Sandaracinaceae bacterium]|nr:MAG: YeeE/YedE family protein [Sandaracinaceae bacterium]
MKQSIAAFFAGLIFAVGLVIAGMTQPSKVVGFLDFFGSWDPSLAFVMGGAIAVHFVLFRVILKRASPLFAGKFEVPSRQDLTPALLVGSGLFGVGWGLGGFCPGPGIVSLGSFGAEAAVFVVTMTLGMLAHRLFEGRPKAAAAAKA